MERLAVYVTRHARTLPASLTGRMARAWEAAGAGFCRTDPRDLPALLDAVDPGRIGEVIFCTDSFLGPLYAPKALLSRGDAADGDGWRLAGDAGVFALRRGLWRKRELWAGLSEPAAGDTLPSSLSDLPELFDLSDLTALTERPFLDEPVAVLDRGCPFIDHSVFHRDYDQVIRDTLGHQGQQLYARLRQEAPDWIDPLWDLLLRRYHMADLWQNMHLTYVLPSRSCDETAFRRAADRQRLLLVMHLYYPDKLPDSMLAAGRFPREADVCVTTPSRELADAIRESLAPLGFASVTVRVIENRGRDVSSLLVGAADMYDSHDLVCFFHDKKTLQTRPGSIGMGFADKCTENLLGSRDYVRNVVALFDENPRLGLLMPPAPHHSDYFFTLGVDWGPNYPVTRQLADRLRLTVPMAPNKPPVAPLGTCFWFRADALRALIARGWTYEDFPPEPNGPDGTLLHAFERLYPFAAAQAGYYSAYGMTDRWARVEYTGMRYYVTGFNQVCFRHGIMSYQREMRAALEARLRMTARIKKDKES